MAPNEFFYIYHKRQIVTSRGRFSFEGRHLGLPIASLTLILLFYQLNHTHKPFILLLLSLFQKFLSKIYRSSEPEFPWGNWQSNVNAGVGQVRKVIRFTLYLDIGHSPVSKRSELCSEKLVNLLLGSSTRCK